MPLIQYGQVDSNLVIYNRITEDSDTRIIESGDTRITENTTLNTIESSLIATATLIVSLREMFYNVEGVWKFCIPYIKYQSIWKEPDTIYIKQSGTWIRVF